MKRHDTLQAFLLIFVLFALPVLASAEENRRDGNWWREQDRLTRSVYVIGFFDGMDLGHNFSYWAFVKDKKMNACMGKVAESYADYGSKFFKNATNGQIVDGLDSFYADFRNRSIRVADAVWLVVNGIAGTPQEELDTMIENWRRNVR
jgi:hypothetical protein